ncbi:hypothetical protein [Kitasatospora sp. NPDC059827]|uniref:hypothetical protein n=1 Tax=Kitasatospora sp. NPDC059827 TaxID=3346964 RepID=UPI00364AD484
MDTGIALGQLGEAEAAEPLIAEGLEAEPTANLRGRAFHTFWLARTQIQQREVELACTTASEAFTLAAGVESPRVTAHLQEFCQLLRPYRNSAPVAELSNRITGMTG